ARLDRDGRAPALAGDLADGGDEGHVDVVAAAFSDKHAHRLADVIRIDAVELEAARRLLGPEARHQHGLAVAFDEGASGDHLAHIETRPVTSAEGSRGR